MAWLLKKEAHYRPPQMTDQQMAALEKFILRSRNASDFAKRVIIWMLRQSGQLTVPVALSLWNEDFGADRVREVQDAVHDMRSANGATHIGHVFAAMGTEMQLMHSEGCFIGGNAHPFDPKAPGRSIWCHYIYDGAHSLLLLLPPKVAELEALELPD